MERLRGFSLASENDHLRGFSYATENENAPTPSQGFSFQAFHRGQSSNLRGTPQERPDAGRTTWISNPRKAPVREDGPVLSQHFQAAREPPFEQGPESFNGQRSARPNQTRQPREPRVVATVGGRLTFGPPIQSRGKPQLSRFSDTQSTWSQEPPARQYRTSRHSSPIDRAYEKYPDLSIANPQKPRNPYGTPGDFI